MSALEPIARAVLLFAIGLAAGRGLAEWLIWRERVRRSAEQARSEMLEMVRDAEKAAERRPE